MFTNRFAHLFDDFFNDGLFFSPSATRNVHYPAVNIWQGEKGLLLRARLPGVKAEELEVSVEGNSLTICAKRGEEFSFSRTFTLPIEVESQRIEARMNNGILELALPVAERALPRKIAVQTA